MILSLSQDPLRILCSIEAPLGADTLQPCSSACWRLSITNRNSQTILAQSPYISTHDWRPSARLICTIACKALRSHPARGVSGKPDTELACLGA